MNNHYFKANTGYWWKKEPKKTIDEMPLFKAIEKVKETEEEIKKRQEEEDELIAYKEATEGYPGCER
jgi:hypothetical protein